MKQLYFLGEGCYQYDHALRFDYLKDKIAKHQLFKGSEAYLANEESYFPPLALFDGTLKSEFLSGNFDSYIIKNGSNPKLNLINNLDVRLYNRKTGLGYAHLLIRRSLDLLNYTKMKERFNYFSDNIKNFIFILDFSRTYHKYGNQSLLKFEKYLIDNKIDLENFYYLSPENLVDTGLFQNLKIQLIKVPLDKICLCNSVNKINNYCCSCYFYTYYKEKILNHLMN